MKKLILTLGLFSFIFFGALAIQNVTSSTFGVEIENIDFDKDPTKDGDKKAKEAKTDTKAASTDKSAEECAPSSAKSGCATKSSCCSSKGKSSASDCPDKK